MKAEQFLQYETHRREAYKLISACYYLPEEDVTEKLAALAETLGNVCAAAAEHVAKMRGETDRCSLSAGCSLSAIEPLRIDYARLFVGPFELLAPPYGSVYLEGARQVMGGSTIDAKNRYQAAGLNMSSSVKEAPDHIAIELEFMYYLIFKEIESLEQADLESAMNYLEKQKDFLKTHLGRWVSKFAAKVEENARADFYKHLARGTKIFVQKNFNDTSAVLIPQLGKMMREQMI